MKYITGYAKLYEDREYSRATMSDSQAKIAAEYRKQQEEENEH